MFAPLAMCCVVCAWLVALVAGRHHSILCFILDLTLSLLCSCVFDVCGSDQSGSILVMSCLILSCLVLSVHCVARVEHACVCFSFSFSVFVLIIYSFIHLFLCGWDRNSYCCYTRKGSHTYIDICTTHIY